MKLLFLTDTHIRGNTPENRLDNLQEALTAKLSEVTQLAKKLNVDYILHGGDFFDIPSPSLAVTGEFLKIFKDLDIPIYCVAGNHDIYGANLNTIPRTVLGFVAQLGFINLLEPGKPIYLEKGGIRVQLTGQPYHFDMDRRPPELDYCVKKKNCDIAIHIVHGMLCQGMDFPGDITLINDVLHTEADITLAGHNHIGFGILYKCGKYFINPGGLVRLTNHKTEMKRDINVVLIDLEGGQINCKLIKLATAKKGDEVLDRGKIEAKRALEQKLEAFAQELMQATEMDRLNVIQVIDEAVNFLKESPGIREETLRRIAIAEEVIASKGGFDE